jgi:hypothetical protein
MIKVTRQHILNAKTALSLIFSFTSLMSYLFDPLFNWYFLCEALRSLRLCGEMTSTCPTQQRKQLAQSIRHHFHRQRCEDQTHQPRHDIDAGFAQYARNRLGQ